MPHVDHSIKLDFKDVLIRPKRSTLRSRADVSTGSYAGELPFDLHLHGGELDIAFNSEVAS